MLLSELIEALEQFQARHEDEEIVVLGTHQMSYPLRERVAGIYSAEMAWEYARKGSMDICAARMQDAETPCDYQESKYSDIEMAHHKLDGSGDILCLAHFKEEFSSDNPDRGEPLSVEIVLDGAPADHNPYGSRDAWSMS